MKHPLPYRPAAGEHPATDRIARACRLPGATPACLLAAFIAIAATQPAYAENFTPPPMDDFILHAERDADGDGDGVNETHIMTYMNAQGDSLFSMTTNGRLWAWSLDTHDSDSGPSNYVIRDSDCDDTFDEVYGLDQEFHVPDCVK